MVREHLAVKSATPRSDRLRRRFVAPLEILSCARVTAHSEVSHLMLVKRGLPDNCWEQTLSPLELNTAWETRSGKLTIHTFAP
jgi:hypothetical protein